MKKLTLAVILASTIGILSVGFAASPAGAVVAANEREVQQDMIRPDSAAVGAHNWATDTFHRTAKISRIPDLSVKTAEVVVSATKYTIEGTDAGTFKTIGTKSFKNQSMLTGVSGNFTGKWTAVCIAPYNPANTAEWPYYSPTGSNADSTSEWINKLWSQGAKCELTSWEWDYATCNEKVVNAAQGNSGDITGKLMKDIDKCIVVTYKVNCDNKVDVTIVNKLVAGVKVKVNGVEKTLAFGTNTYTGVTTSDGWLYVTIADGRDVKTLLKVKCIKATSCPTQTPSATPTATPTVTVTPTAPPAPTTPVATTAGAPSERLALTGEGGNLTPKLFIGGAILTLMGAVILILLSIRNNRHTRNTPYDV